MFRPVTTQARPRRPGARDPGPLARAPAPSPGCGPERGRAALELPRRADHGQQPDGRPPRLGPHLQGPLPALPRHARPGPALAERLRLPGPVGRGQGRADLGFKSKRDIEALRHRRVREPVQAAGADVRRPPDRAVHPPGLLDGLGRPGRAAPPARPAGRRPGAGDDDRGPGRPGHRHGRDARRAARHAATSDGSYFTFSNENNDIIWGFLAKCHERGWLYKGHDTMPWCARCGTGLSASTR